MNKGFTLVELLVVVLIIGVLSAIALPQYTTAVERSRSAEALSLLSAISDSAQRYYFQHNKWPEEDQWEVLDIDVPVTTENGNIYRGGKNFIVTMVENDGDFIVTATRRLDEGRYYLISILHDDTDLDTVTVTRSCSGTAHGYVEPTEKALVYCNAITGGHNDNF